MKTEHALLLLCANLQVSPSGYYDWLKRRTTPGLRARQNQALAKQIEAIHTQSRETYGSPRIVDAWRKQGARHGRNRVARLMREEGLQDRQRGRYRVQTTDSNHDQPIALNLMAEVPAATAPNQIWVGDITYIETPEGWLYLAAILDRYSRKIVGWSMSERIDTDLVLKAFNMALVHRHPTSKVLFHSDRHFGKCKIRIATGNSHRLSRSLKLAITTGEISLRLSINMCFTDNRNPPSHVIGFHQLNSGGWMLLRNAKSYQSFWRAFKLVLQGMDFGDDGLIRPTLPVRQIRLNTKKFEFQFAFWRRVCLVNFGDGFYKSGSKILCETRSRDQYRIVFLTCLLVR